jgi:hypothetical protein
MSNLNKIILLGIFDILVSLPFIASNWWIWDYLSGKITANAWGPLQIAIVPKTIVGGQAYTIGLYTPLPNYPFILFWVALAGNLLFFVLALRSNNKKQPSS